MTEEVIVSEKPLIHIALPEDQLRKLIVESVQEALTRVGVDPSSPMEMQKDFQHLRNWRCATAEIQKKSLIVLVGIVVSGICGAAWLGLKSMLVVHPASPL